jgi:hypothetical protein
VECIEVEVGTSLVPDTLAPAFIGLGVGMEAEPTAPLAEAISLPTQLYRQERVGFCRSGWDEVHTLYRNWR